MYDVPFVATPEHVVRRMLTLASVGSRDIVYDLGAGDGRIIIMAAREFGAKAVGIELRKDLYFQIERKIKEHGLEDRVKIIYGSFYDIDISDATVVTLYLLTSVNEKLRPKLERDLHPGTRVVSHDFEVPGWKPLRVEEVYESWTTHKIFMYKIR